MHPFSTFEDKRPEKISIVDWDKYYDSMPRDMLRQFTCQKVPYVSKLSRHIKKSGDRRLASLKYDNSLASLRLWNFLLTENERLFAWRKAGKKLIGVMKDLGTIPVMVYSLKNAVAFYPEGSWWIPCVMEMDDGLFKIAEQHGIGDEACPARAAIGAFVNQCHFPIPDLCVAGTGSCCDDFSAIMQCIEGLGHEFLWWELPYRKELLPWYKCGKYKKLPNGERCPVSLFDFVVKQLELVRKGIEKKTGEKLTDKKLVSGIKKANRIRKVIGRLRQLGYSQNPVPLPALELLICEMIAIHFCSDREEALSVLEHLLKTVEGRVERKEGVLDGNPFRVTWVNPVADIKCMNVFEELGGRLAGTEYLFSHALAIIPEDMPPLEALAAMVLLDPMIGSAEYRARRIIEEAKKYEAEGVIVSLIPGASHCASEGRVIGELVKKELDLPVLELTIPPVIDAAYANIKTKMQSFFEILSARRPK